MVLKIQGSLSIFRCIESGGFLPSHPNLPSECHPICKILEHRESDARYRNGAAIFRFCHAVLSNEINWLWGQISQVSESDQPLDTPVKYTQESEIWWSLDIP